jgi:membrane-bound ClpP family serine protease
MEFIYIASLVFGVGYLLLIILGGLEESLDFGVDGAMASSGVDGFFGLDLEAGEATGLGCSVIAAFLAGFGAVGLTLVQTGAGTILSLAASVALGYLLARGVGSVMKYVIAQQHTESFSAQSLIGSSARVTINSGPGETGEVIIEEGQTLKYPVKEIGGAALQRGDIVEIVDVVDRFLHVKKKRVLTVEDDLRTDDNLI